MFTAIDNSEANELEQVFHQQFQKNSLPNFTFQAHSFLLLFSSFLLVLLNSVTTISHTIAEKKSKHFLHRVLDATFFLQCLLHSFLIDYRYRQLNSRKRLYFLLKGIIFCFNYKMLLFSFFFFSILD